LVLGRKVSGVLRLVILAAVVIGAVLAAWKLGYFELDRRRQLVETVQRWRLTPFVGPLFIAVYALAVMICLPVAVMTILGGAIFGSLVGALLSGTAAMLGTIFVHFLARSLALAPARRVFGSHRLMKHLREHSDVMTLLRLRVLPIAPFGVLDYVAGLAGVSMKRLLIATAIGILPSVVAYSYVGAQLLSGLVSQGEATRRGLWIAGAVTVSMMLFSVAPALVRRMRE
jgi:uncharacterized membrane protein YdjX (TVP38/TMEM64 family)